MEIGKSQRGRGAQINPKNRFFQESLETDAEYLEHCHKEEEEPQSNKTSYIEVFPKKIVNKVNSPDIPFIYSMNPYQGCEHGCVYCYARTTHEYWGYSSGLDFERKILAKKNAPDLLRKELSSKNWKPSLIMLSGNTDCYQPIEKKLKITRQLLKVLLEFNHPVGIITKNSLLLRDLDLLEELNRKNLLRVTLSVTSLDEETRRKLEPRTASAKNKLKAIRQLSDIGVPVSVNLAPIIPGINDHEIPDLLKAVSEAGAKKANFIMVRLNGSIGEIFTNWVREQYPLRADKILHQTASLHGGQLNSTNFNTRMRGQGKIAEQIRQMFHVYHRKYFEPYTSVPVDTSLFTQGQNPQLELFS